MKLSIDLKKLGDFTTTTRVLQIAVLAGSRRKDLTKSSGDETLMSDIARRDPVVAVADEPLRTVVYRMAESGFTRMPVVDSREARRIVGMVSLDDLLHARARSLSEERTRERVLRIRLLFVGRKDGAAAKMRVQWANLRPHESKIRSERCDGMAVQHLSAASRHCRLLLQGTEFAGSSRKGIFLAPL